MLKNRSPCSGNENQELVFGSIMEYRRNMNLVQRVSTLTLCSLLVLAAAVRGSSTELKDNPYKVILVRNPFGLKSAPPPVAPPSPPSIVKDVKFTGITSDGNLKRAWFVIPPTPGRSELESLSLSEGESHGGLHVVEINEKDATVKILNGGTPVTVNFGEHGLPAPARPAARVYRGQGAAGYGAVGLPLNAQKLAPARSLLTRGHSLPVVSRLTGLHTNTLLKAVQARTLPSVKKNTPSLRLARP